MRIIGLVLVSGVLAAALPCKAATREDMVVMARALSFTDKPPKGELRVGIVYLPTDAASRADADNLLEIMKQGLTVGDVTLKPELVKLGDAGTASVDLFFLANNAGSAAAKLADTTTAKHKLCVTTDIEQVKRGACIMGVQSQPKTEIVVNRAAAAASGTAFSPLFRMMITEF